MRALASISLGIVIIIAIGCGSSPESKSPPPLKPAPRAEPTLDEALARARVLDLTYGFGPETIYWPSATAPFARKDTFRGKTEAGFYYAAGDYAASEHGGTHMDAPSHFNEKGLAADAIAPVVGPAWVLDARAECALDPNHLVSLGDLKENVALRGDPPPRAVVLVLTGWGRYWPDKKAYLGDDRPGKTDALSFPGLDPALAKELIARKVRAVGIDTASIDRGKSMTFESHQILAAANVPIFENIASLDALELQKAWIIAAPTKIVGGTGGPLRLAALVSPEQSPCYDLEVTADELEILRGLAPIEAQLEVMPSLVRESARRRVVVAIAPVFSRDDRRAAELEAQLVRAMFAFIARARKGSLHDGWKAPPWPLAEEHPRRHLEHGTPDERIKRYEDPARDAWQKPDEIVRALALAPTDAVADLGVGSGYLATRIARAYPKGRVIGLDVEPDFVAFVNERAKKESLANLEARLVPFDDPKLAPSSVDVVVILNTYHHIEDRSSYLAKLRSALRPGGRVVVIDFKPASPHGPPAEHKLAKEQVLEEARLAGLVLAREQDVLPEHYFLELAPPR